MNHVFVCLCTAREPSSFVSQFGRVLKRGYVISFHYHLGVIRYSYLFFTCHSVSFKRLGIGKHINVDTELFLVFQGLASVKNLIPIAHCSNVVPKLLCAGC